MNTSDPGPTEPIELVTADEVAEARTRLHEHVTTTPMVTMGRGGIWLKLENLHGAGSFKTRGAFNSITALTAEQRHAGVVAHSSGNHAIAVAEAARELGVRAVIVMPDDAPAIKRRRTLAAGAEVIEVGPASSERAEHAAQLAAEHGYALIEPYDSRTVIAATATIAIEMLEAVGDLAEIYVPISGGGLAAGVALGAHLIDPGIRVIGVEPAVAADALASWRAGSVVTLPAQQMATTIADGLRVQRVGRLNWPHLQAHLHDIVTVTEDEIRTTMRDLALDHHLVAEPSGAVPVAAARRADHVEPARRAAVLCGGNVDPGLFAEIIIASD